MLTALEFLSFCHLSSNNTTEPEMPFLNLKADSNQRKQRQLHPYSAVTKTSVCVLRKHIAGLFMSFSKTSLYDAHL